MTAFRDCLGCVVRIGLRNWPEVIRVSVTAAAVEIGLHTVRLPTLARWVGVPLYRDQRPPAAPDAGSLALSASDRRKLHICKQISKHWPVEEKCLRLALVSGCRLRHLGPQLVVGVAVVHGQVRAHAWLAVAGTSLDPSGSERFHHLTPVGQLTTAGQP